MAANTSFATIQKISVALHVAGVADKDMGVDKDTVKAEARVRDVDKEKGAELIQRFSRRE